MCVKSGLKTVAVLCAVVGVMLSVIVLGGSTTQAASDDGEAWFVRCNTQEAQKNPKRGECEIFQRISVKENNQRLIEFAVGFPADQEEARSIIILPLGVLLASGVEMRIDDGKPFRFNVRYCDVGGCFAYVSLDEKVQKMLRKGENIMISFRSVQGKTIQINMSLKGFSKALKKIS